jgi:hypothetical protein
MYVQREVIIRFQYGLAYSKGSNSEHSTATRFRSYHLLRIIHYIIKIVLISLYFTTPRTFIDNTETCDCCESYWVAFHFPLVGSAKFVDSHRKRTGNVSYNTLYNKDTFDFTLFHFHEIYVNIFVNTHAYNST